MNLKLCFHFFFLPVCWPFVSCIITLTRMKMKVKCDNLINEESEHLILKCLWTKFLDSFTSDELVFLDLYLHKIVHPLNGCIVSIFSQMHLKSLFLLLFTLSNLFKINKYSNLDLTFNQNTSNRSNTNRRSNNLLLNLHLKHLKLHWAHIPHEPDFHYWMIRYEKQIHFLTYRWFNWIKETL
jgi:hypothetical protein